MRIQNDGCWTSAWSARLLTEHGFEVTAQPADAETLVELVGREPPNVVVTDIRMLPTGKTRDRMQRNGYVENTPKWACSYSRNTSRRGTR